MKTLLVVVVAIVIALIMTMPPVGLLALILLIGGWVVWYVFRASRMRP